MMHLTPLPRLLVVLVVVAAAPATILALADARPDTDPFEPLHHLGANSPWFAGPDVHGIANTPPAGCTVDQAVYVVRHGSRYPDPGAWKEWQTLYSKLQNATFTARGSLSFLPDWTPALLHPEQDIAQVSLTGYTELTALGAELRFRYPTFYTPNTRFPLFANAVQRTTDSARLFARGYLGPNATTLGTVYVVNASDPRSLANSLAPSDLCVSYRDDSSAETSVWDKLYLPSITARLQALVAAGKREEGGGKGGDLELTDGDVGLFPYLCGFETQIMGRRSPWCGVFLEKEVRLYEYRQDLRYFYGVGPGSGLEGTMMLEVLGQVVEVLKRGGMEEEEEEEGGRTGLPPRLVVAFTHDGQINQLATVSGAFDGHANISASAIANDRTYRASNISPMRGTVAFERLSCSSSSSSKGGNKKYVRLLLNDAVYPVPSCQDGPGRSCGLEEYGKLVEKKVQAAGEFGERCGNTNTGGGGGGGGGGVGGGIGVGFLLDPEGKVQEGWVRKVAP